MNYRPKQLLGPGRRPGTFAWETAGTYTQKELVAAKDEELQEWKKKSYLEGIHKFSLIITFKFAFFEAVCFSSVLYKLLLDDVVELATIILAITSLFMRTDDSQVCRLWSISLCSFGSALVDSIVLDSMLKNDYVLIFFSVNIILAAVICYFPDTSPVTPALPVISFYSPGRDSLSGSLQDPP